MKFIDQTSITVRAGKGGDGLVCFNRARNMPKLGPYGGNGGTGGDVILIANEQLNTLSHIRYKENFYAEDGGKGGPNGRTGKCGRHLYLPVPVGTVIVKKNSELVGELCKHGDSVTVAKGGKWGYGNMQFTTATRQAPDFSTDGQPGEELVLDLELKLLADVGLAGFPNAGKSTLLSRVSAAKPKIADYPFTTLTPQLGVVECAGRPENSFVMADIPGLIEGASMGRGLGHDFLRHLERTKCILFMLDGFCKSKEDIIEQHTKLQHELLTFQPEFSDKTYMVAINKKDIIEEVEPIDAAKEYFDEQGMKCYIISAYTGDGIERLKSELYSTVSALNPPEDTNFTVLFDGTRQDKVFVANHSYLQ